MITPLQPSKGETKHGALTFEGEKECRVRTSEGVQQLRVSIRLETLAPTDRDNHEVKILEGVPTSTSSLQTSQEGLQKQQ